MYRANYCEIEPYLYVGNKDALDDVYLFDLVINCSDNIEFPSEFTRKLYNQEYIRVSSSDVNNDIQDYNNILELINNLIKRKKKVIVIDILEQNNFTPYIIIAQYLIKYMNKSIECVIKRLKLHKYMISTIDDNNFLENLSKHQIHETLI